ncbi:MAG: enoyl-CoA hydratase/isomerase family protein [Pseudomonadales bacterium]|jgi:enoyl-CoA hydratase|nr:enoyl-CoA hydratase/isomerase family protein [Pseudomonadales bacterium]MCP5320677.1 enoyl-CoA hydratase/isomerase family protein [Pseudomonadales bacterium]
MDDAILALQELPSLLADPERRERFSPLTEQPFLLFDTTAGTPPADVGTLAALGELACPVIAIRPPGAPAHSTAVAALADVVVESARDAQTLIRNIRTHPRAAMVLVQVLRHTARATITDGLLAESLAFATLQGGAEYHAFLARRGTAPKVAVDAEPPVLLARTDGVLEITLNRPAARNAFSTAMRDGLVAALHLLASDPTLHRARIRGAGACFCSGGDLEEFGLASDLPAAHAIRSTRNAGRLIAELAPRVECHVHRACIGSGIELPAFAGRIVATPDTLFQLPEISLGLIPGAGGTVSITRRVGRQRTAWLALSARRIDAPTALAWGLIDAIEED